MHRFSRLLGPGSGPDLVTQPPLAAQTTDSGPLHLNSLGTLRGSLASSRTSSSGFHPLYQGHLEDLNSGHQACLTCRDVSAPLKLLDQVCQCTLRPTTTAVFCGSSN